MTVSSHSNVPQAEWISIAVSSFGLATTPVENMCRPSSCDTLRGFHPWWCEDCGARMRTGWCTHADTADT